MQPACNIDDQLVNQNTFPGEQCRDHDPGGDPYEFVAPKPCPPSAATTISLDTRRLTGDGRSTRINVVDAAGNATTLATQDAWEPRSAPDGSTTRPPEVVQPRRERRRAARSQRQHVAGAAKPLINFAVRRNSKHLPHTAYMKSRVVSLRGRPTVVGRLRDTARHAIGGAHVLARGVHEGRHAGSRRVRSSPISARRLLGTPCRRPPDPAGFCTSRGRTATRCMRPSQLRLGVRARVTLRVRPRVVRQGPHGSALPEACASRSCPAADRSAPNPRLRPLAGRQDRSHQLHGALRRPISLPSQRQRALPLPCPRQRSPSGHALRQRH